MNNPAVAAIEYALNNDEPEAFLRCWFTGNFEAIRREWENVPEEVFIGADPLHPETKKMFELQSTPSVPDGWREAAVAWEVCASIHREYARGKDPFFSTRQGDFAKHAQDARDILASAPKPEEQ